MKRILSLLIIAVSTFVAYATEEPDFVSRFELNLRPGYSFNSNPVLMDRLEENGTVTHSVLSGHLKYSFMQPSKGRTGSVYQGIGVSYTSFMQSDGVGSPMGVYVFQGAPIYSFSDKLSIDYEWNFGATFGWNATGPDDEIRSNLIVGSRANAYLNLGFKLNEMLSKGWGITAVIDLSHYSNGNTSWPNPGVNTIGGMIGLVYVPGGNNPKLVSPFSSDDNFKSGISYDVMGYGAWRKAYFPAEDGAFTEEGEKALLPGHFGIAGLTFAPMWDVHPTFRTGLSLDLQWGENTGLSRYHIPDTYGEDAKFYRPPFFRQLSAGLSARAELVMPIFSLNVGIGYGLLGPSETRRLYQVAALKTYVTKNIFINVGYRLFEFKSPSNLMLGMGYTFGR